LCFDAAGAVLPCQNQAAARISCRRKTAAPPARYPSVPGLFGHIPGGLICRKPGEHLARNPDCAFVLSDPAGKVLASLAGDGFANDYQFFRPIFKYRRALSNAATKMSRGNLSKRHRTFSCDSWLDGAGYWR
jgi:hypothetical protein